MWRRLAAAGSAALIGLGPAAQAEPMPAAPATLVCGPISRTGRTVVCDVALDLTDIVEPADSEPKIVHVQRRSAARRRTVIETPEPAPAPIGVWTGRAVLQPRLATAPSTCDEPKWISLRPARKAPGPAPRGSLPTVWRAAPCGAEG